MKPFIFCCAILLAAAQLAEVNAAGTCDGESCVEDFDVCEPIILRQNVGKKMFLVFCNFTEIPTGTYYEVETRAIEDKTAAVADTSDISSVLAWQPIGPFNETGMLVTGMKPFTRYEVRAVLRKRERILGKSKSIFVSTNISEEAPSDSPRAVFISNPENGVIAVAWKRPMVLNAPLLEYQLTLEAQEISPTYFSIEPELNFFQIRGLQGPRTYTVSLRAKNRFGMGPPYSGRIALTKGSGSKQTQMELIVAVGKGLHKYDTNFMYFSNENMPIAKMNITDMAVYLKGNRLFFTDDLSRIFSWDMQKGTVSRLWQSKERVLAIDFNWLSQKLFVLHVNKISIVSTGDSAKALSISHNSEASPGSTLTVDPLNGYMFVLTDGILYRAELPTGSGSVQFNLLRADVRGFAVVPNTQALFVANSSTIVQLSYDWSNQAKQKIVFVTKKRKPFIKGGLIKDGKQFYFVSLNNGVLVSLNFMRRTKKFQANTHDHLPNILPKLISTNLESQPTPVPYRPPGGVSAVCWRRQCSIAWKPPPVNAGATKSAWQKWNYVITWRDLTSSSTYKEVVNRRMAVLKKDLKTNSCLEVSIAAIGERNEGPASTPGVVCTNGLEENTKLSFVFVRNNRLFLEDRTTDGFQEAADGQGVPLKFDATTIFSIFSRKRERRLWAGDSHGGVHLADGEGNWRALTSLPRVQVFALEPRGRTLYFVSSVDGWIYRWRKGWNQAELLIRSSGVRGLSIDPEDARLFWCSGRQVFASGLHGENGTLKFTLPDEDKGASIANVLWDQGLRRLLLVVQSEYTAWTAAIWQLIADGKAKKLTVIRPIKSAQSLRVVGENLFWSDGLGVLIRHASANLTGKILENATAFHVERLGADAGDPREVFPCAVTQLRTEEVSARRFRLRWNCSGFVPPRQKFEIEVAHTDGVFTRTTRKLWTELHNLPPHALLNASVLPFTRWIRGEAVQAMLWSPFADPEAPSNLRFLQHRQLDLLSGALRTELQMCWRAQALPSRPIGAFQLRLACPACPQGLTRLSRKARCTTIEAPAGAAENGAICVELQACGPRGSCGENTTVGCAEGASDLTNSTWEQVDRLAKINNASDSALFWGKNFLVMARENKILVSALDSNATSADDIILHRGDGNISHIAADWDRDILVWTEELAADTYLWAVNLTRYEASIRRLQSLGGSVEKLELFSSIGELQWRIAGENATSMKVVDLQGLSRYANAYEDASPEDCELWAKDSVECQHPQKSSYQLRIQPGSNRIIEFSPKRSLCRYRKIKGSASAVKSLQLIHTCFVSDTPAAAAVSSNMAPTRHRRSASYSSFGDAIINVRAKDRRLLRVRRYDGEMIGQERHHLPLPCQKMRSRLEITQCGPRTIAVKWTTPGNRTNILRAAAQVQSRGGAWKLEPFVENKDETRTATFEGLSPNTRYRVRLGLIVCTRFEGNKCPKQDVVHEPSESDQDYCSCLTTSDIPRKPPKPNYQHIRDRRYRLTWDSPEAYGSKILKYLVDTKDATSNTSSWITTKEAVNNSADLSIDRVTDVRIRAQNRVGISDPSPSLRISPSTASAVVSPLVVSLAAILFCVILAIIVSTFCWYRRKKSFDHRRSHLNQLTMQMEMRNLAGSPGPTEVNALYANATKMEAIDRLPRISRHQLEIASNKYLGAGAFGQVWEGLAKGLFPNEPDRSLPVAMKTLRRGATSQEREDFLQEALLMSNFNHDHIVRLLGVCLDGEPQFIILELMNKGDLKSYLRAARPSLKDTLAALSVPNLLGIILDVAKGCAYLEEQHFVHRDIAARNCLVTYRPDGSRVTKIGDFGLARDVYRNDYYRNQRKEAMLPVRWMSPEALVDGFFSSQSDVWAFGVLCWEVMTLGQQPYAARTHSQVMRFVRAGGMLDRPNVCPEPQYQLMVLCWSFSPQLRPTFSQILNSLYGFEAQTHDPYSPFAQPVYFQNYATNDFTSTLANSSTRSSGDSSECTSNPACPGTDTESTLGARPCPSSATSCYETPLSRPYLDLQSDTVHYVNSRVVGLPPLGCDPAERKRPLSIDACRSPGLPMAPQMVCLAPPASPPGQAEILMAANGDINYRSIRVEEPSNEYHTPNPVPMLERQISEPQPVVTFAAAAAVAAAPAPAINGMQSWRPATNGVVHGGSASSGTIRSSVSSNGDSSLTSMSASTGSRHSGVGFAMANGTGTGAKALTATVNGRPLMAVSEPSTAPKVNGEYASRSYDRL